MSLDEKKIKEVLSNILNSIQLGDNVTYKKYVSPELTCFEPESLGNKVLGLNFHLFFGNNVPPPDKYNIELINPTIRVIGSVAYACYTILISKSLENNVSVQSSNETRIFHKNEEGNWKIVHFHRSDLKKF